MLARLRQIAAFPANFYDFTERDRVGRDLGVHMFGNYAIRFWEDPADGHLKVRRHFLRSLRTHLDFPISNFQFPFFINAACPASLTIGKIENWRMENGEWEGQPPHRTSSQPVPTGPSQRSIGPQGLRRRSR